MYHLQNQNPPIPAPGQKRPRTDQSSEGDWTCPNCGNVNFSFRTTCNMRKCATPKPTIGSGGAPIGHAVQMMQMAPPPILYDQQPHQYITNAPPQPLSVYGTPPAGTQMIMGGPPPLGQIQSPYDSAPATYLPPGSFVSLPMVGGGYQIQGAMDPYRQSQVMGRFDLPILDGRKRRGGPDTSGEGDWICPNCGNKNFAFRSHCNMRKCNEPKPSAQPPILPQGRASVSSAPSAPSGPSPEGSWTCKQCGNVNYPFRTHCNRRNCGVEKPAEPVSAPGTTSAN